MTTLSVSVIVSSAGAVRTKAWQTGVEVPTQHRVDLTGLDGRLLRLFERWLVDRDRVWTKEEIQVFGQLLHRQLFPNAVWSWIRKQLADPAYDVVRLMLAFPSDAASSPIASLPWEFLCAPGEHGEFLALTEGLMLSRTVPPGTPGRTPSQEQEVRILPVVGDSHNDWLGEVDYEPVLEAITDAGARADFVALDPAIEVSEEELADTVVRQRPHVVHSMGHGRFSDHTGRGAVALRAAEGGTAWVDEDDLGAALCSATWAPTVAVLHACEGGRNDYEYRHAGLAPALVRQGVQCVVAMQYAVTNATATEFSAALYDALAGRQHLDEAVQTARRRIRKTFKDARLVGVPMVYQRNATPLLGPAGEDWE